MHSPTFPSAMPAAPGRPAPREHPGAPPRTLSTPAASATPAAIATPAASATPAALAALAAAVLLLAAVPPAPAAAQVRDLHWDSVVVEARLDHEGRLHVRERQVMVFTGEWNGGERRFDTRLGQELELEGISRVDPATGRLVPLNRDDDLDDVHDFGRVDGAYRWRSRHAGEPAFSSDTLTYVLDYTLANAVVPRGEEASGYVLDHDFLFHDRAGSVERFVLELELDPAWRAMEELPARHEAGPIPPGNGYGVHLPLRYQADGRPATVLGGAPTWLRLLLAVLLVGGSAWLAARFFGRERDAGRYEPLPEVTGAEWLEEHVLRWPPELVGAAWDHTTSAPEVAGLLARLVQEGKLASRVDDDGGDPVLHLELLVPRSEFGPTERPLIDALFFDGRDKTDTKSVKAHYKKSGFDPAGTIREALTERVAGLPGHGKRSRETGPAWRSLLGATALLAAAVILRPSDGLLALIGIFAALALCLAASGFALFYGKSVHGLRGRSLGFLIPTALLVLAMAALITGGMETTDLASDRSPYYRAGPLILVALAALGLAAVRLVLRIARPAETRERLALRRRLAAARAWLDAELRRPEPALRDEWFPWILAFGLGPKVDRWFRAHGAADGRRHSTTVTTAAMAAGASAGSSGSGRGWTGGGATFGGGGGFSGGGVGGSWAMAATTVASGVAPPSSSGGSGSSGGSSSSGGGGGGGW